MSNPIAEDEKVLAIDSPPSALLFFDFDCEIYVEVRNLFPRVGFRELGHRYAIEILMTFLSAFRQISLEPLRRFGNDDS